jgi:hypothetical protein
MIGTPQYMAPEQAAGDPKTDHRADLYAFGVLSYECLVGVPPFVAGSAADLATMRLTQEPPPLSTRRPTVPGALQELVMRCLQKRPADRWQSAADMMAVLNRVDQGEAGSTSGSGGGTVTARLPITESTVRRIDRSRFDPRMIGDSLEYLDNQAPSDVLVMLLNSIWLDGSDFEPHLRMLPYRCFAPTLYGFGSGARHRFALSLRDHMLLLAELLKAMVAKTRPSLVIVVGFSASADLVLKLGSVTSEGAREPDGILALGPNQGIETCFVSRVLAKLERNDPADLLAALRTISTAASSLDDWLLLNGYLGRIMNRFRGDVSPMRILGRDIIEPFERDPSGAFAEMYREATSRFRHVRCVFEDSETCNRLLRDALTAHMDGRILGDHHRDGSILIEPTPSHFDLIQPERLATHLTAMVKELRESRA